MHSYMQMINRNAEEELYFRPQRSCGKVMFLHESMILFGGGGGLCPSMHHRSHDQGGLCPGGSLSRGSLSRGSLSKGGLCPGGLYLGGLCPGGLIQGGSLSKGVSVQGGLCLGGLC